MAENKPFIVELIDEKQVPFLMEIYGKKACVCYDTPFEKALAVAKSCIRTGHFSPSRGQQLEFLIRDIPRSCADQLVRHVQGTSPAMMSFRYVNVAESNWYTPKRIQEDAELEEIYDDAQIYARQAYYKLVEKLKAKGYTHEQAQECARGIIPMNTVTNLAIGMSLEAIINLCSKRLCNRAEEAIGMLAVQVREIVLEHIPEMERYLKAPCVNAQGNWRVQRCPEGRMCCASEPKYLVSHLDYDTKFKPQFKELLQHCMTHCDTVEMSPCLNTGCDDCIRAFVMSNFPEDLATNFVKFYELNNGSFEQCLAEL